MAGCLPHNGVLWHARCQQRSALPVPRDGFQRHCTSACRARRTRLPSQLKQGGNKVQLLCKAGNKDTQEASIAEADVEAQLYPSPFFEAFVRTFVLGLGFGALFEVLHVGAQFLGVLREVGWQHVAPSVLMQRADLFSPNYAADHAGALGSWFFLYVVEAVALQFALDRTAHLDPSKAAKELSKLMTVPKRMLPWKMVLFKQVMKFVTEKTTGRPVGVGLAPGISIAPPGARSSIVPWAPPRPRKLPPPPEEEDEEEKPRETEKPQAEPPKQQEDPLAPAAPLTGLAETRTRKGLAPGQWDASSTMYVKRMADLSGRRAFLKNFWYAAGISDQVKDKPVFVEMLGERLVLWRDERGNAQCMSDVCLHRGAPMHKGKVVDFKGQKCLECPYHGWKFDAKGALRDVPASERKHDWAGEALPSYPVKEKGGFIWLFWGSKSMPEDERPPIPFVPELEDPAWRPVYGSIEFNCPHWGVFENAIDMAHIHYLHGDTFGNQSKPEIRSMTCTADTFGALASFSLHNKPVNPLWNFSQVPRVDVTAKALLPSTSVISFTLARGLSFTTFVNTVPIDGNRTINRFALIRRLDVDAIGSAVFNSAVWDSLAVQAMLKILGEDKAMVEELHPELLRTEVSVKADLLQLAFRKKRQEFVNMGYGVAPEGAGKTFYEL